MTAFVFEPLDQPTPRRLFSVWDTQYIATRFAWLNVPISLVIGVIVASFFAPADGRAVAALVGVGYGALILAASFAHTVGHAITSRWANAPVTYVRWSATVATMHYDDELPLPTRVHIFRAVGGPAINLALGLLALLLGLAVLASHFVVWFGVVNLAFAALTISPVPSLDGATILRELSGRGAKHDRSA